MHPVVTENLYGAELYRLPNPTVVVVHEPWRQLGAAERELLSRILQSIQLSLSHVYVCSQPVLNVAGLPVQPKKVVAFTAPPAGLALYTLISSPPCPLVVADPLPQLVHHDILKKQLWQVLKGEFAGI